MDDIHSELRSGEEEPILRETRSGSSQSLATLSGLPASSSRDQETAILQAAVFIEDGIAYRSIFHKLTPRALRAYRLYYSLLVQWLIGLVIFVDLILAFFEYPNSLSLSSDPTIRPHVFSLQELPCGMTESVEFVCLLFFSLDCAMRFYFLGWRRFLHNRWLDLYVAMLVVSYLDMFISLGFCPYRDQGAPLSLGYTLRIRRFFRPLIFLLWSSIMKKFIKAIKLTLPQIFNVLILLVLHLYVFTMVGLLIFPSQQLDCGSSANTSNWTDNTSSLFETEPDTAVASSACSYPKLDCPGHNYSSTCYRYQEGTKYFGTVWDGFVNLTVTLTTANHPDVMMPIYRRNRFASIYFIIFLMIGLFLIFNVLIAVIYNQFKGFFQKSMQSSFTRRRVAFHAAFTVLARNTRCVGGRSLELVSRDLVRQLLQRAKLNTQLVPDMYQRLETMAVEHDCLRWGQFCEVFDVVSKTPHSHGRHEQRVFLYSNRALAWVQFAVRHRYFRWFTHAMTLLNILLVTVELQRTTLSDQNSPLVIYNFVFVIYYTAEQTFRLVFLGYQQYFQSRGNLYDGCITLVLLILQLLVLILYRSPFTRTTDDLMYDILIRLMNIFIVLRLLRVIPHIKQLALLANTMLELVKNLRGFAGIIVVIYYLFALLGMELFSDMRVVNSESRSVCGSYDNLSYYANNFNDFASSLVVLWDIMVVNNWYVFLDKFSQDSHLHEWSKLYFIAWWLVSVVVCANLFISLVLETFLVQWDAIQKRSGPDANGPSERYGDSFMYSDANVNAEGSEVTDIHDLLSSQLVEPQEADIMHELQQHRDLQLA